MVALLALVTINVILRYVCKSVQGTYDYVQLITAVSGSLAVAYTAYERGHIEIEILMERLPKRVQSGLAMVMMLICTGVLRRRHLAVGGGRQRHEGGRTRPPCPSSSLRIPSCISSRLAWP